MRLQIIVAALFCQLAVTLGQRGSRQRGGGYGGGGGGYGGGGGDGALTFREPEPEREGREGTTGRLQKVYEWKQLTYNINGQPLLQDRFGEDVQNDAIWGRSKRQSWPGDKIKFPETVNYTEFENRPDSEKFFIQYNNVPMGVERWRNKLFVTVPRRRYGIPSTLNYLDLNIDTGRSPGLRPYPSLRAGRGLLSVYRTRVDECDRLWMVDTGLLEIPNARVQRQPPAIVVFDLKTDRQILRYPLKSTDLINERTPGGLASITVDMERGRCDSAFAYIPDLATYGLIVYSLQENDSWRVSHNFFSFSPVAGNLNIASQQFSWNDGIFSVTLGAHEADGFRRAFFHPMVSYQEFSVSTRALRDRTLAGREFHGEDFKLVGERGSLSQSTMHARHEGSDAILYAEVGRDAISCWNAKRALTPDNKVTLAQDHRELIYPSDLHITGDEVWLMSNTMPRFIYSTLDTTEYNFRIYKGNVYELISGTACEPPAAGSSGGSSYTRPSYSG